MNDNCSVFQAEIFSILKAVEAIADGPTSYSESYMIFVDNQAAIKTVALAWCKSRLVRECKKSLSRFPSHNGILGNETAYVLTRFPFWAQFSSRY